eukprot:SAG31_NODE_23177_length_509_cov_1.373171_1_plen_62_part_00
MAAGTARAPLQLLLLLLFVHREAAVVGRIVGVTSDMESKFTPAFLAVLQEQVRAYASELRG